MANSLIVNNTSNGTGFDDAATYYVALTGRTSNSTTEANVQMPIRDAGTFSNLFVYVPTNTASVTTTITLRKSLADTAVTVSYTSDQTGIKEDTSNSVAFANTDEGCYEVTVPTEVGTNTISISAIGIQFAPTTTTNCVSIMGSRPGNNYGVASTTQYGTLPGRGRPSATDESNAEMRIRGSFTMSDFYTYASANARTTTTTFKTRKNSADGGQTVAYTSGQTGAKEDTSGTDSLVAGDDFNYSITTGTGTENIMIDIVSCTAISTANQFIFGNSDPTGAAIAALTTTYTGVTGPLIFSTTEANSQVYPRFTFTASELGAYVSANTNAVLAFNVTLRDNGADSAVTVSYAAAQTGLKNDSSNTAVITTGADEINYEVDNLDATGSVTLQWMSFMGSTVTAAPTATSAPYHTLSFMGV